MSQLIISAEGGLCARSNRSNWIRYSRGNQSMGFTEFNYVDVGQGARYVVGQSEIRGVGW